MCKTYVFFCLFQIVYNFHSVESLMTEHVMSMVATLQTSFKHKLLSVQENLHITSEVVVA